MSGFQIALLVNYILCILLVLDMVFVRKKKAERILAWTIFLLIPFVGLVIYLVLGAGLDNFSKSNIKKVQDSAKEYHEHLKKQIDIARNDKSVKYQEEVKDLIVFNFNSAESLYSSNNTVDYFCDGQSALDSLLNDIKNAKSTIHMEFYIFSNDEVGKQVKNALIEKVKQGVEVRLLFDAVGSVGTKLSSFSKLKKAGGKVAEYLPPFLHIDLLNINANYRNHRKICVIDGKVGYTGGFNIRKDHMGKKKRLSPWRDTTIKLTGSAVNSLQDIFLSDWRFATRDKTKLQDYFTEKYFPVIKSDNGSVPMQILKSGPDSQSEDIKACMIKMIVSAKKYIKIQSPYFVPDDAFLGAIKVALLSGVKVEIMIPQKIDHTLVHFANYSYLNDLLPFGLNVYVYTGFIHSKVLLVDDQILTVGSSNLDIRSFALNFEVNAMIYDSKKVVEYSKIFEDDKKNCTEYTLQSSKKKSLAFKLATSFCRLFSGVL